MPTNLPDPVLALSIANLQKLNSCDVDQLANLWTVFSKCKENLEAGRRLENLSWRLWFREAHIMPPDSSLSDLADFTPLGSPLQLSRRSSFNNGNQSSRVLSITPSRTLQPPVTHSEALSDPEDGNEWSSDDDDANDSGEANIESNDLVSKATSIGRLRQGSISAIRSRQGSSSIQAGKNSVSASADLPIRLAQPISQPGDRKRAVSSSSAFGSRARVKQTNMKHRRRPLSFQQAIESLLKENGGNLAIRSFLQADSNSSVNPAQSSAPAGLIHEEQSITSTSKPSTHIQNDIDDSAIDTRRHVRQVPSDASNESSRIQKSSRAGNTRKAGHHSSLIGASRNKSAIGLTRALGKGHGRGASSSKITSTVVKFADEPSREEKGGKKDAPQSKAPVKFTMGGMEGESDEDEEVEGDMDATEQSDDWSSDSSTDSETRKHKQIERQKVAEQERVSTMFQKIPIRTQSAADVRATTTSPPEQQIVGSQNTARGMLSTMFDRRQSGTALVNENRMAMRKTSQPESSSSKPEGESMPSIGGLKLSKSAVALPVLSTLGSRSDVQSSRNAAVFDDEDSSGGDEVGSYAVNRLNELTQARKKAQKVMKKKNPSIERNQISSSSLDLRVHPDLDEEAIRQQRRTSAPTETPAISAPVQLPVRSRSAVNIPDITLPQSPRTTRRNMLRDELSESMRQHLLYERQSRNRLLGIGVEEDVVAPAREVNHPHPPHRAQTVLGNTALRPLTQQRNGGANQNDRDYSRYTGDFHHTGW